MHGIIEDSITSAATIDRPFKATRRQKPVRLSDIAKEADVSIATVSMVLNDNPRISAATAQRVRRIVQRMGYQPLHAAQVLAGRKSSVIAVLVPQVDSAPYFTEMLAGVCEQAASMGHTVQLERVSGEFVRRRQHTSLLEQRALGGMLLLGCTDHHRFIDDFDAANHPVVVVDNKLERDDLDFVGCDYSGGAQQALNYLLQLGHRKIGLIASSTGGRNVRDVVAVYRGMMSEHGVRPGEGFIGDGEFTEAGGADAAEKILRRHDDVTAILAASDTMAIGAMHAAARLGKAVPTDVSIVGIDNLRVAAYLQPALTTVQLPLHGVGARACQRLIERISGQRSEIVRDVLPTHLILRNSAALTRTMHRASSSAA